VYATRLGVVDVHGASLRLYYGGMYQRIIQLFNAFVSLSN
jgi:hypothetical protein